MSSIFNTLILTYRNACVAIQMDNSTIYSSKCTCQHDLGERCSHVGAVLYMLEEIAFDESPKLFQSTTDRLCYWSKGAVTNRNPKALGDNDYERVFPENRYKDFDPIPERFKKTEDETNEDIDKFLGDYLLSQYNKL